MEHSSFSKILLGLDGSAHAEVANDSTFPLPLKITNNPKEVI